MTKPSGARASSTTSTDKMVWGRNLTGFLHLTTALAGWSPADTEEFFGGVEREYGIPLEHNSDIALAVLETQLSDYVRDRAGETGIKLGKSKYWVSYERTPLYIRLAFWTPDCVLAYQEAYTQFGDKVEEPNIRIQIEPNGKSIPPKIRELAASFLGEPLRTEKNTKTILTQVESKG